MPRNPLGSIFKRQITKHGKTITVYDVRKRIRNAAGVYKDKTRRCYSYAEALAALPNLELSEPEPQTAEFRLPQLIDYFRQEYVKPAVFSGGRKISGYRQNLDTVRRYIDEISDHFGDVPVRAITYEQCRRFYERLASTPTKYGTLPAPSTYHKKLTILGRLFNVAIQLGELEVSPLKRGKPLIQRTAEKERNRMLTYEEEERLLAVCVDKREHLRPFIICALDTAMRRGEIYNLRWWQVDFNNGVIYLTGAAASASKTGVEGILPLTDRLALELRRIYASRRDVYPDDLVLGRVEIKRSWGTACRLAGIDDLQFRDLRSTATTRMLLSGNVGELVQKVTRHTKAKTMLKHYTNIDVVNAQTIGKKLESFNQRQRKRVKR